MRFRREKSDSVVVIRIFQSAERSQTVLKNLYRARFRRAAAIHSSPGGSPRVEKYGVSAIGGAAAASVVGLATGAFIFWQRGIFAENRPGVLTLLLAAFAFAGAVIGWVLVRLFQRHVDEAWLARCSSTILPAETVVMAEVKISEAPRVLVVLREVEAEGPGTFAFHSPPPFPLESTTEALWDERPSIQRFSENAAHFARSIVVSRQARPRGRSFLRRLRDIEGALEFANTSLTMSAEM